MPRAKKAGTPDSPAKTPAALPAAVHTKGSLSRTRILDVASRQFDRKGYDRTSLEDVAKALSVTKPSLYYHFEKKEDILLGCVTEACDRLDAALAVVDSPALVGRRRLEVFLRAYLDVISDNFGVSLVLADDRVMSDEGRLEYFARRKKINTHVMTVIEQGQRDGSLEVGNVSLTAYAIFGMFNWVTKWRSVKPKYSLDDIYERFMAMLFKGLEPPGKRRRSRTSPGASRQH